VVGQTLTFQTSSNSRLSASKSGKIVASEIPDNSNSQRLFAEQIIQGAQENALRHEMLLLTLKFGGDS
jgi:hypothetical protein